jgi:hypothetical protein
VTAAFSVYFNYQVWNLAAGQQVDGELAEYLLATGSAVEEISTGPAVDTDGDGVPDGPAAAVLAWVEEDPATRAAVALEAEQPAGQAPYHADRGAGEAHSRRPPTRCRRRRSPDDARSGGEMTSLATPSQLASRLQMDLDLSTAQLAVDGASGMVRVIARQQFDFVSQETVVLRGGERVLTLPQRPLVVDTAQPADRDRAGRVRRHRHPMVENRDYSRVGSELTRGYPWWWNNSQRLMGYPRARPLGVWAPRVQVTYSHGFARSPTTSSR